MIYYLIREVWSMIACVCGVVLAVQWFKLNESLKNNKKITDWIYFLKLKFLWILGFEISIKSNE
jgi:hypothetical protein